MIRKIEIDCRRSLVVLKTDINVFRWKYKPATDEGLTTEIKRLLEMIRAGTSQWI